MQLDSDECRGRDYDLRASTEVRTENRFREWAQIVMSVVDKWDERANTEDREWFKRHNGIRNPFTVDGVKARQPVDPGGDDNNRLAQMWPKIVEMLGPRRTKV